MASKTKTEIARDKHEKDLRDLQDRNARERLYAHSPDEVHEDVVVGSEDKDGNYKAVSKGQIDVFGGRAYVKVDAEFDKDDLHVFAQQIEKASQAVQV